MERYKELFSDCSLLFDKGVELLSDSINEPATCESLATRPLQYVIGIDNSKFYFRFSLLKRGSNPQLAQFFLFSPQHKVKSFMINRNITKSFSIWNLKFEQ